MTDPPHGPAQPTRPTHQTAPPPWLYPVTLAVITLLALTWRLWRLGDPSFWLDEIYTANLALHQSLTDLLTQVRTQDAHPPLSYLLLWGWAHLTGQAGPHLPDPRGPLELIMRLPGTLLGSLNVLLCGLLGGRLAGRRAGVIAALLAATSGVLLAQDRELRMYPLLTTELLTAGLLLDSLLRARQRRTAVALGLTALGMLYTHYLSVLLLGALFLWTALRTEQARAVGRTWWYALAPTLLFLPWLPVLADQLRAGAAHPEFRLPMTEALPRVLSLLLGSVWPPPIPFQYWPALPPQPNWAVGVTILLALLSVALLAAGLRAPGTTPGSTTPRMSPAASFIAALPVGFLLVWILLSLTLLNLFDGRYLGPLMALWCIGLGIGATTLGTPRPARSRALARVTPLLLTLPLMLAFAFQSVTVKSTPLANWKEMVTILRREATPDDLFILRSSASRPGLTFYGVPQAHTVVIAPDDDLPYAVKTGRTVWFIGEFSPRDASRNPLLRAYREASQDWLSQYARTERLYRNPQSLTTLLRLTARPGAQQAPWPPAAFMDASQTP